MTLLSASGDLFGMNRIRELREEKGLTIEELAERVGTKYQNIQRIEVGRMPLTEKWMRQIAPHLGVAPGSLLSDDDDSEPTVPIVGYVGAGEVIINVHDPGGGLGRVAPPGGDLKTVAVVVRGESMYPRYLDGELLFFEPNSLGVPGDCIGRDCVVQVRSGPTYIKRLMRGARDGLYRLVSYKAPDIDDVDVLWASRVRYTVHT